MKTTNTKGATRREKVLENSTIIHYKNTIKASRITKWLRENSENRENIEMIDSSVATKDRCSNIPRNRRIIERISDIKTTLITRTATRLRNILLKIDNSPETKIISAKKYPFKFKIRLI